MFENFGYEVTKLFKEAEEIRYQLRHPYVGSEHLLLSILKNERDISQKLSKYNLTYENFKNELQKTVGSCQKKCDINLYTPLLKRIIYNSLDDAKENNKGKVTPKHLLLAMLEEGDGVAIRIMVNMKIDLNLIYKELRANSLIEKKEELLNIGINLNKEVDMKEKVVNRENEIDLAIETLLRKKKNNPLLVGHAGVGKSAIVEEIARRINKGLVPNELKDKQIIMLEMGSLVAGTKYRGEFEERLNKIIKEASGDSNIILFIDEIHTMVNAGGAEGAISAGDIFKPYLARGDIKCIGATTIKEYEKYIEKDKALARRFECIKINEPDKEETINILLNIKKEYEEHHKLKITKENIIDIVSLTEKYIKDKYNPDKSIDILDMVCSVVKNNRNVQTLNEKIVNVQNNKKKYVKENNYEKALLMRNKELNYQKELKNVTNNITKNDILKVIESKTGIPLLLNHSEIINNIKQRLNNEILGQKEAILAILNNIGHKYMKNDKPLSMLLLGPTGVGKTQTVKVIAKSIKGVNLLKLDMSEYNLESSITKLIGCSQGYVGYEDDYLLKNIKHNPFSIILIDEIEKAHPRILNLFLQMLDDGYMTDSKGEKIYFNNTMIFITSNLVNEYQVGFSNVKNNSVENYFSKELLGRIDDIIEYNYITLDVVKEYLRDYKNIDKEKIIKEANYEKYGLRNVKNIINKYKKLQTN